jgi:hypothetical protein
MTGFAGNPGQSKRVEKIGVDEFSRLRMQGIDLEFKEFHGETFGLSVYVT